MLRLFINRPILSLVISLLICMVGILSFIGLPITQFPDIVPPSVTVTAKYTGANADVCVKTVATPIERAINGVPGMTYMSSVSSNNGVTIITVYFKVGTDPDVAAVNVQNRVTTVLDELPEEVIRAGVVTEKEVNSMLLYLNLYSEDSSADEKFVYNFADINILPELKRIDGVGFAEIMGSRDYSMRVWLKPEKLAAYNISTQEVIDAIRGQNVEAAPGKTGESSDKMEQPMQYVLRYTGKFFEPDQYENIILKANADGSFLKLKDLATVEFGSFSYQMDSKTNGQPSASIMLKQRPGSNAKEVIDNIKNRMKELEKTQFPPKMKFNVAYDVSRFLDASIHEVIKTFIEALLLVFIVVFLFLQDFRSTLIPALAVPVALIGTFGFMSAFGFSINLLTLFAMVLAIGIVVDDAIVVVEAVHAKMEELKVDAKTATLACIEEIGSAIVAITLVMSAVFIPVAFMDGPVGIFYRQFSLTLAVSIVISGINALTLTPALCALLLKPHHHVKEAKGKGLLTRFFAGFNFYYDRVEAKYKKLVEKFGSSVRFTFITLGIFIVSLIAINFILPTGFIPTEDQGVIYVNVNTPPGATVERTGRVLDEISAICKTMPTIENISSLGGYSLITESAGASYGMAMINLKPWDQREESVQDVIEILTDKIAHIKDAKIEFFPPPTVPGFGNASGFELRLIDKTGTGNMKKLDEVGDQLIQNIEKSAAVSDAFTNFDPSFPQYLIHVDYEMAAKKDISVKEAMNTLQTLIGSFYASNFVRFGQMYKVMVQASPEYRRKPEDILHLYIKNNRGEMVPFSTFIKLERVFGTEQITRYNMNNAIMINGEAAAGFSSGDAINAVEEAAKLLPRGYTYEWSGITREEINSGDQAIYIFIICLLFVYLLLAAQYESFILPLPVLLSLPMGIFGAFASLWLAGLENNIYAQVSLVMLIGLLGKNAILIIEFALLKQQQGASIKEAMIEGATARLRPILMTSFAFVAGLIPLVIASGPGELGNRSIGTSAAGGMLIGTVFGVIIIPGLYFIFARIQAKFSKQPTVKA
ncbi:MAG: efflux RND transporter permease subunit [Bacteroidia bacterium]|jgi:hydrophobe/amphiphile efflux-1 (HAE1) family protein|nr:efflux RND transporter permease subunit [Bacteroidia bacterium]